MKPFDPTKPADRKTIDRWYQSRRWRKRCAIQLKLEPLCRMCKDRGRGEITPGQIVDHIVPHKGDYTKFWMGAVQVVCERCHKSTKFEIEHRGYSCEIGVDGNPTDARHPWNRD